MRAICRLAPLALFILALLTVTPSPPAPAELSAPPATPQASPLPNPGPMPGCVMHVDEWGRCTGIECPWGDFQC